MEAKQVTEVKQNGSVIKKYFDYKTGGNSYMWKQERRMKRYISTYEITLKKFIIENWSFDFLSVLISFKLQLYSIQIKTT